MGIHVTFQANRKSKHFKYTNLITLNFSNKEFHFLPENRFLKSQF